VNSLLPCPTAVASAALVRCSEQRKLTSHPFAINHIPQTLDAEAFRYALEARPAVMSFALADPDDLVRQAHDVGSRVMLQVTTVAQAAQAAERGVDIIIAQGGEAGGYCDEVSTMALVPQVVDAVSPIPVVAAGGIFDGRGIAAACWALPASTLVRALSPARNPPRWRNGSGRSSRPSPRTS